MAPQTAAASRSGAPATRERPTAPVRRGPAPPRRRVSGPARPAAGGALAAPLPLRLRDSRIARRARARLWGVLDALLAGRGWIVLVGVLLVGIVFFNVDLLRTNREIARTAARSAAIKRENARLRLEAAQLASSDRIQEAAAGLGMVLPAPGDVRYLRAYPGADARKAARLVSAPDPGLLPPAPVALPEPIVAPTDPATTGSEDTSAAEPPSGAEVDGTTTAPDGTGAPPPAAGETPVEQAPAPADGGAATAEPPAG